MDHRRYQKLIAELNRELGVPDDQPSVVHRMVESARHWLQALVEGDLDLGETLPGPTRQRLKLSRSH